MIAAIYARKSTDDSDRDAEARSCERQIEHARRYAVAQGWTVDDRYVFRDDAVSGAEWKHRPGWAALLAALVPAPPFERLIVTGGGHRGIDMKGRVIESPPLDRDLRCYSVPSHQVRGLQTDQVSWFFRRLENT